MLRRAEDHRRSCARVWVLDGGHAIYVVCGFGLSMPNAPSPRALMAGLPPAANARGGERRRNRGIGGMAAGGVLYRGGSVFARKK